MSLAIILDRDGTLIKDTGYLSSITEIQILEGVINGLKIFLESGFDLHVVSNQSGLSRGLITFEEFRSVDAEFKRIFAKEGIIFESVTYCLHSPAEKCICRKPSTGMLQKIEQRYEYARNKIAMMGDSEVDKLAAENFGVVFFQVSEDRKDFLAKAIQIVQHFDAQK